MTAPTELPCRQCGAPLAYSPGALKLVCPFCGAENEIEGAGQAVGPWGERTGADTGIRELDYEKALRNLLDAAEIEETATLRCPGCGAEVSFDAATLADRCPFCATPLARGEAHPHRHPKPQGVLPFALDARAARERMTRWLGSRWFAPSGLKKFAEAGRPLAGVYVPHYTYDAVGEADYTGQRGDAYYVTRTRIVNGKSQPYQERRIRWRPVAGHVRHVFDDVLVPASDSLEGSLAGEAEYGGRSWDLAALEPYRPEFLAGFRAEAPQLALDGGYARAQAVMEQVLVRDIKFDIGGDAQQITSMQARYSDVTFKHVLLPVWLASYRWGNKAYQVVVNGRTGAVSGERPYSAVKIAIAVILAIVVAVAIGYVVAVSQG
jgi:predicted RNA-binding Zn-ribbon protein involved in translation (DUF1610 family)